MNRFPDMFQTVTDRDLFGVNTSCIVQALSTSNYQESVGTVEPAAPGNPGTSGISEDSEAHPPIVRQKIISAMSQQLELRIHCSTARLCQSWRSLRLMRMKSCLRSGKQRTMSKGGPLDSREVKTACETEIKYLWDMEVYEYSTEAEARARTGRNPVGFKWIDTNKGSAEAHVTVPAWRLRR